MLDGGEARLVERGRLFDWVIGACNFREERNIEMRKKVEGGVASEQGGSGGHGSCWEIRGCSSDQKRRGQLNCGGHDGVLGTIRDLRTC